MDFIFQHSLQRQTAHFKGERCYGKSLGAPWGASGAKLCWLGSRRGFSVSVAHVPRLDDAATFLLISLLARVAAVISDFLLAASRVFFELIEALPPGLPHIALTARLLPAPAPAATPR